MSVPEGKRTESKLEVQTKAKQLAVYTVGICGNEKYFPKRDRWIITNRIVSTVLEIMEKVDESYTSWKAHANNGDSYNTIQSMDRYYRGLWEV